VVKSSKIKNIKNPFLLIDEENRHLSRWGIFQGAGQGKGSRSTITHIDTFTFLVEAFS
jgi:hypothetical protein